MASITSCSAIIEWETVPCGHQNGDITGYQVKYREVGSSNTETMTVYGDSSSGGNITLSDLAPSTMYDVQVAGVTSAGVGVYSSSTVVLTLGIGKGERARDFSGH